MEDSDKDLLNSCSLIFSGIANKNLQQYIANTQVKALDLEIKELEANIERMTSEYKKSQLESTEMQKELNEEDASLESVRSSLSTGSSVIGQLQTLVNMTQKEAQEYQKQYDETIDKYEGKYLEARKIRIEYSSEYKNRVELEVQQKHLEVTIKALQEKIAQDKRIRTLRRQVEKQIYFSDFVAFAKTALTYTNCCNLAHQLKYAANRKKEFTEKYKQYISEVKQHEEEKQNTMRQVPEPKKRNLTDELTSLLNTNLSAPVMNQYTLSGISHYPYVVGMNTKKQIKILDTKIINSGRGRAPTPVYSNTTQNNTTVREEATTTVQENKRKNISTKSCETNICTDGFKRSKKHMELSFSMKNKLPEASINNKPEQAVSQNIHRSIDTCVPKSLLHANTLAKSTAVNPTQTFIQSDSSQNSVPAIGNWDRNVCSDNSSINAIFSQTVPWDRKQTSIMTAGTIMDTFKGSNDMKIQQLLPQTKIQNLNQPQYSQSAALAKNWGTNISSNDICTIANPSQDSADNLTESPFMEAYKSQDTNGGTQSISQRKLESRNNSDTATLIQSQYPRNAEPSKDWEKNLFGNKTNNTAYFSKPSIGNFAASTTPQNLSQNKFQTTSAWDMAKLVEKDVHNEGKALTANEKQKLEAITQENVKDIEHMEVSQDKPNMSCSMQFTQSAASTLLDKSAINMDNYSFGATDEAYQETDEVMSFDGNDCPKSNEEAENNFGGAVLDNLFDLGYF